MVEAQSSASLEAGYTRVSKRSTMMDAGHESTGYTDIYERLSASSIDCAANDGG